LHPSGAFLGLAKLAIDTGYESPAVYAWARRMGVVQVVAVKGVDGFNRAAPVVGPTYVDATEAGRRIRRGARLWTVAAATFKSETYRFLRLSPPTEDVVPCPAGYVHLPRGVDAEWVKQLVGEQLVTVKTRRGFTRLEWQKLRERNEALDCRVYARAAAWIAGIDRWPERKWRALENQLGLAARPTEATEAATQPNGRPAESSRSAAGDQHRPTSAAPWRRTGWLGDRTNNWLRR
jgi:phage terminase large subunit GpA-like protein